MMSESAPFALDALRRKAISVASNVLLPNAERVDQYAEWPREGLREIAAAGLMGLHVPIRLGGHGEGLRALSTVTEELARACASTAMCFAMHCVGTKVLSAKATYDHEERYLRPIAQGRHITSLALSEAGTGVHFYLPRTQFRADSDGYVLSGQKSFVTNGGNADSYVVSAIPPGGEVDPGTFSCIILDSDASGIQWLDPWEGLGMRGNSSRAMYLNSVGVPRNNLLGSEGDQIWYAFEIVSPYFLVAMTGVYIGIAQAALDATIAHLRGRKYDHTGRSLESISVLSDQVGQMYMRLQRSRQLLNHAASLGDAGDPMAPRNIYAAKLDVAETVVAVTNGAIMVCGGLAYRQNSVLARLMRDAQAAHVMSPTSHLLNAWLGRSVLGLPII